MSDNNNDEGNHSLPRLSVPGPGTGPAPGSPKPLSDYSNSASSQNPQLPHYALPTEASNAHSNHNNVIGLGHGHGYGHGRDTLGSPRTPHTTPATPRSRSAGPTLHFQPIPQTEEHPCGNIAVSEIHVDPTSYESGRPGLLSLPQHLAFPLPEGTDISAVKFSHPKRHGKITYEGPFFSHHLHAERTVRIYLPPSYHHTNHHGHHHHNHPPSKRYPVLYAVDGQNMFSTGGESAAFGWGPWMLDTWVDRLVSAGLMSEIIIVGIDCHPRERYHEFRGPAYPYTKRQLELLEGNPNYGGATFFKHHGDDTRYDRFVHFLIDELKPQIDKHFHTLPQPQHTGIMGSSMGGVVSVSLGWQRPDIFGLVGCVSGALGREERWLIRRFLMPCAPFGGGKKQEEGVEGGHVSFEGNGQERKEAGERGSRNVQPSSATTTTRRSGRSLSPSLSNTNGTANPSPSTTTLSTISSHTSNHSPHQPHHPHHKPTPSTPLLPPIPTFSFPVPFKIYMDSGTLSTHPGGFSVDDLYSSNLLALELRRLGWKDGQSLWYHVDDHLPSSEDELLEMGIPRGKWDEAKGNQHHEGCWRNRVWRMLCWLFPAEK